MKPTGGRRVRVFRFFFLLLMIGLLPRIPYAAGAGAIHLDVPFVAQTEYQCGPAALTSVLRFWNIPADREEMNREVFSRNARGSLNLDMAVYAKKKGLDVRHGKLSITDLQDELRARRPVVVLVDLGFWVYRQGHYLVLTGMDDSAFFVHDGLQAGRRLSVKDFNEQWNRADNWGLIARGGVQGRPCGETKDDESGVCR